MSLTHETKTKIKIYFFSFHVSRTGAKGNFIKNVIYILPMPNVIKPIKATNDNGKELFQK
jgi:hypothetical protein